MLSQFVRQRSAAAQLRLLKGRSLLQSSAKLRHHFNSSRLGSLSSSSNSASPESSPRRLSFQSSRSLATAIDNHTTVDGSSFLGDDKTMLEDSQYNPDFESRIWARRMWGTKEDHFQSPDSSSLVILEEFLLTTPKVQRKIKGIGGNEAEMLANLQLSLRVSQFDRASKLLTRLREFYPIHSSGYLDLHNKFLEAMVSHAIDAGKLELALQVQRWFEVDMPYANVKPNGTTFAIMIRLALRMLSHTQRDRAVRRYWSFAKGADLEEEVLADAVLSERELGLLSEICFADLQRVAIDSMEFRTSQSDGPPIPDVTPVRPTAQLGSGLSTLKESIAMFSSAIVPVKADSASVESTERYNRRRQEQLEQDVMRSAIKRWEEDMEKFRKINPNAQILSKQLGPLLYEWQQGLTENIKEELRLIGEAQANPIRTQQQKDRCDYGVYLHVFSPERLASLTILAVMGSLIRHGLDKGAKLAIIATMIGNDMYDELMASKAVEQLKNAGASKQRLRYIKKMLAGRKVKQNEDQWRHMLQKLEKSDPLVAWSSCTKAQVGAVLLGLLFEAAKLPVRHGGPDKESARWTKQPAFQHSYQINWGRRQGYIHVHPEFVKLVSRQPSMELLGRRLPMLCKPRPWTGYAEGAYLLHSDRIVRTTPGESLQPRYVQAALENSGLEQIRHGLDILGTTGWNINRDVFNVQLEAWNTGDPIADLAPLEPNLPHPPKPSPEEGHQAMRKWNATVREIENVRGGYHSQRCFQNFQLEVARSYLNETFYFPHNMDFRGRAYPLPPYLNQMGADNVRGLLLFSEAKPLGERGLRWLKIQIANLAGFDKASLSEREQFAMDNLDDILDSANNGLHGRRWWLKAEDPWQCLAACCELRNALNHPVPAEYPSRLPIHQDGSCNGLQHYAALGGDLEGAQQVNLEPSDRPSDVYSGVADFVKKTVSREAAEGNPVAKLLDGKITRKVVKQTVMTNVYGVTFMGAMKQVRKQLADYYPELTGSEKNQGAFYIADKIFEALGSMFTGAHQIQYWLGDCASRITSALKPDQVHMIAQKFRESGEKAAGERTHASRAISSNLMKEFKSTVIWTTPLGLPVVQPYRTRVSKRVSTTFQTLSVVEPDSDNIVSRRKQLQAFPPNFIHSLDATHMMLSAIACRKAGLCFSAVHDSFWTHPSDVDTMNGILRDEFVRMHSDDVVKRLAAEFEVRYGKHMYLARVRKTGKIGQALGEFRQGKSYTLTGELVAEYDRQRMLNSRDPEMQAKGREMVTPAALFEKLGGTDDDLVIPQSLGRSRAPGSEDLEAAEKPLGGESDATDPLVDSLLKGEFDTANSLASEAGVDDAADLEEPAEPKKKQQATLHYWMWLPMRFREVPQKGAWDLTRIRDSEYFFS
ncbi:hypothetical protein BJY00DRAFT_307097 [Aspergillus carlsbadensis]|nr:hypothetical protein BJY00DRAFT_307097 [Aspergillus carlsbadensis]